MSGETNETTIVLTVPRILIAVLCMALFFVPIGWLFRNVFDSQALRQAAIYEWAETAILVFDLGGNGDQ